MGKPKGKSNDKPPPRKKVVAIITPPQPLPPREPPPPPDNDGLRCPRCHSALSDVVWTRPIAGLRIRMRQCVHCGTRFRTAERHHPRK